VQRLPKAMLEGKGWNCVAFEAFATSAVTRRSSPAVRISPAVPGHAEAARIAIRVFGAAPAEDWRVDQEGHRRAAVARYADPLPRSLPRPAAATGVALASGVWALTLSAFAPLSVLPLGFLAFGLLSSLRRAIARHATRGRLVPTGQTFGFPILRVAA
jgi:hypothetical protein